MTQAHSVDDEFLDYTIWRERYYEKQTNAPSLPPLGLDLSLGYTRAFSPNPHLEPLSDGATISFIDRLIDGDSDQASAQPSSADDRRSDSSVEFDNGKVDDEDMWELAPDYDALASEKQPLGWDNSAADRGPSPFLTEQPLQMYEPIYQSFAYHYPSLIVREEQLIESLIQTLCGHPSICFRWNSDSQSFEPRTENLRIIGVSPSALDPVLRQLLVLGTQMRKLERMTRHCKANPNYYGLTGTAFACCLADLHIRVQHSIWTVFKSIQPLTVMMIFHTLSSIMETMGQFSKLTHLDGSVPEHSTLSASAIEHLCKFGFYIPFGKDILALLRTELLLYDFSDTGNPALYRDICLATLCHASVPYLKMLSRWLGLSGREMISDADFGYWTDVVDESPLRDPYGEFFLRDNNITRKPIDSSILPSLSLMASHSTESFMERYQPRGVRHLPYFLSSKQANVVARTGCALQLLRQFQPNHPLCAPEARNLGLRWITTEAESREYITKMHAFVNIIRKHNADAIDAAVPQTTDGTSIAPFSVTQQEHMMMMMDSHGNDDVDIDNGDNGRPGLSISRLPEINLVSEFSNTLDRIMETHENPKTTDPDFFIPSLDTITAQSVHRPLELWCPLVNESSMSLFIHKFHIQEHLRLLHRFFLFGDDMFSSNIVSALFGADERRVMHAGIRPYSRQWPPRASDLNMSLRAVLLESIAHIPDNVKSRIARPTDRDSQGLEIDDMVTFGVRETHPDSPWRDPRAINAYDFLYLVYQVPYPITIVITPRILEKYNRLFSFLLQIHRLNAATKKLYQTLHQFHGTAKEDALHRMRFRIDQFMTTLGNYVFDTAIHATWRTFMDQVQAIGERSKSGVYQEQEQANDIFAAMDPILFSEYHEHVLDRMLFQCFLKRSQRPIRVVVQELFEDVLGFSQTLDDSRNNGTVDEKQCREIIGRFGGHAEQFVKVLTKLDDRGVGRLGNVMNSFHDQGTGGLFGDFYDKQEARLDQGAFASTLLTQLDISGFYVGDK